jgi:hypothetical protein
MGRAIASASPEGTYTAASAVCAAHGGVHSLQVMLGLGSRSCECLQLGLHATEAASLSVGCYSSSTASIHLDLGLCTVPKHDLAVFDVTMLILEQACTAASCLMMTMLHTAAVYCFLGLRIPAACKSLINPLCCFCDICSLSVVLHAALTVYVGSWRSVKAEPPQESMTHKDAMKFPIVSPALTLSLPWFDHWVDLCLTNNVLDTVYMQGQRCGRFTAGS